MEPALATPHDPTAVPSRRGGLAGASLPILGLTLANPLTILSFGALFAGFGVTGEDQAGAVLITIGVRLGSTAWWVLLTTVASALRIRLTTAWVRRVNVASGVVIGAFAVVSIASVVW